VEPINGRNVISVELRGDLYSPRLQTVTAYPLELIEHVLRVKGPAYVCDEITREEDPNYVQRCLRRGLFSYRSQEDFAGRRVLDFGSGSGSSTLVLTRLLSESHIVGVELDPTSLALAKHRAEFYGVESRASFRVSPDPRALPAGIGMFDYIVLSAVYEHLLPGERDVIVPLLWSHLKQNGLLFVNQTPYRWFPIEMHTTDLAGINYLPDGLAHAYARRCSRRVRPDESWEELLRRGIRGASPREIRRILDRHEGESEFLAPSGVGVTDHIDLWYRMPNNERPPFARRMARDGFRIVRALTRQTTVPTLTLAIRKVH
jgi:SAM-dependent methyltransferase